MLFAYQIEGDKLARMAPDRPTCSTPRRAIYKPRHLSPAVAPKFEGEDEHQADLADLAARRHVWPVGAGNDSVSDTSLMMHY